MISVDGHGRVCFHGHTSPFRSRCSPGEMSLGLADAINLLIVYDRTTLYLSRSLLLEGEA